MAGDLKVFTAARIEARTQFDNNRNLSSNSNEASKAIEHAESVAQILKENVVQGITEEGQDPDRFSKSTTLVNSRYF